MYKLCMYVCILNIAIRLMRMIVFELTISTEW